MAEIAVRRSAVRSGVRLELFTVAWMLLEAVAAITAGVVANSLLLTAFGIDSVIELLSGLTRLWLLWTESKGSDTARVERMEVLAVRISAVLLVLLCAYVLMTGVAGIVTRTKPGVSGLGVVVSGLALFIMPVLGWRKGIANRSIGSPALRADIAETACCAYMAGAALAGTGLNLAFGWWWAEYVGVLALLFFLVRETREVVNAARKGEAHCSCD